jgi:RNase P/RNase MRP subunit p30
MAKYWITIDGGYQEVETCVNVEADTQEEAEIKALQQAEKENSWDVKDKVKVKQEEMDIIAVYEE